MLQDGVWGSSRLCSAPCQDRRHRLLLPEWYQLYNLHLTTHEDSLLCERMHHLLFSETNDLMNFFYSNKVVHLQTGCWESCHTFITTCNGQNVERTESVEVHHHTVSADPAVQIQLSFSCAGTIPRRPGRENSKQKVSQGQRDFLTVKKQGLRGRHNLLSSFVTYLNAC